MRGVRTCSTRASTLGAMPLSLPEMNDQSARSTSDAGTGKRPTEKLHSTIAASAATAIVQTRAALLMEPPFYRLAPGQFPEFALGKKSCSPLIL